MATPKAPWSSFTADSSVEADSRQRQLKHMSHELAGLKREHSEEMAAKDRTLEAGIVKRQKLQKLNTLLKEAKYELDTTAKAHARAAEAAESENKVMARELKRLCREVERSRRRVEELEAEMRTRPDTQLRMRIKALCVKYHPDKTGSGTKFESVEVARDLVALLNEYT